jgi:hypothetical protein
VVETHLVWRKDRLTKRTNGLTVGLVEFIGQAGMANAINESGLYKLINPNDERTTPFRTGGEARAVLK